MLLSGSSNCIFGNGQCCPKVRHWCRRFLIRRRHVEPDRACYTASLAVHSQGLNAVHSNGAANLMPYQAGRPGGRDSDWHNGRSASGRQVIDFALAEVQPLVGRHAIDRAFRSEYLTARSKSFVTCQWFQKRKHHLQDPEVGQSRSSRTAQRWKSKAVAALGEKENHGGGLITHPSRCSMGLALRHGVDDHTS